MKVQVKNLRAGDDLGSCKILNDPRFIGDFLGSRNRMAVDVEFPGGFRGTRIWGKYTTVTVINRNPVTA